MEHQPQPQGGIEGEQPTREHDRVPTEGRWLYVVTTKGYDEGDDRGRWLPANSPPELVIATLEAATGCPLTPEDIAVIDQVGLPQMADEDHFGPGGSAA